MNALGINVLAAAKKVNGKGVFMKGTSVKKELKLTSLRPKAMNCQTLIFSRQGYHVNHSQRPIQLESAVLSGKMRSFFSMYYGWSSIKDLRSLSLKTFQDYFPTQKGAALRHGSFIFKKWGMMRNGRIFTGHPSGSNVAMNISSSLVGIIKKSAPEKYYFNGKQLLFILSRFKKRHGKLFRVLQVNPDGSDLTILRLSWISEVSDNSRPMRWSKLLACQKDGRGGFLTLQG